MSAAYDWSRWSLAELEEPAWPSELPQHLSASALSMLERCPEQYRRRYLLGEREIPSGSLVWGVADGKAHAVNFVQKIDSHEDLPAAVVMEAFAAIMDLEVEEKGGMGEVDWRDDKPADIKDRGVQLVAAYHRQVSPRVQPTAVEQFFQLDIPGVPVPFVGYVDVSTEDVSIERKTASQGARLIPPQYQLQTLGYALARSRPVDVHISTRTRQPRVVTPLEEPGLQQPFDPGLVDRAQRIIAGRARYLLALYETFGPEEPWPDAVGTMAWHTAICDLCGWGPNGSRTCSWWS